MGFANNMEQLGFEKSGWTRIYIKAGGSAIMGKPSVADASENDPVWTVKTVKVIANNDGSQAIEMEYSDKQKWAEVEQNFINNRNYQ